MTASAVGPPYESVRFEVEDQVATITLNRPEQLNTWTGLVNAEIGDALSEADDDDAVRAIVITGAGRAFCAGLDIADGDFDGGAIPRLRSRWPWQTRKPVIAAVNGHAVGVGATYAVGCDIRFVAEDAKIAFAFVRRGAIPELATVAMLPRVMGFSAAADLLMSGRTILGAEAARLGLASSAVPAAEVLAVARAYAREIAIHAAPVSVAVTKRLLWHSIARSVPDTLLLENALFPKVVELDDAAEGIASFLEKRVPRWSGRPSVDAPLDWS